MKISQAIDTFLTGVKTEVGSKYTVRFYGERLRKFSAFTGDVELTSLTIDDLRKFVVSMQEQNIRFEHHKIRKPIDGGLSPVTIHATILVTKIFYNWLTANDYLTATQNVAVKLKLPKLPKHPPKAISDMDMAAMFRAVDKFGRHAIRNRAILYILGETGCRVSGLCNLKLSDINLESGELRVIEKGDKARDLFLGKTATKMLSLWLNERGTRPEKGEYVFVGEKGRMKPVGIRAVLTRLAKFANVTGRVNPHSWRHAFARRHLMNGGDISFLSDLMGHNDIMVTKNAYSIFTTDELKAKHLQYSSLDNAVDIVNVTPDRHKD